MGITQDGTMLKSMTGFGKASEKSPYGKITAEIKTLNHKSLGISCTPFNGFFLLEEKVKKLIETKIHRGKVFVRLTRENMPGQKSFNKILINGDVAKDYLKKIKKLKKDLSVEGDVTVNDIIELPGVIENSSGKDEDKMWPHMKKALSGALGKLIEYRISEGSRLEKDFLRRLKTINTRIRSVKRYEKQSVKAYRKRLNDSIKDISADAELDKGRLETEVALFAKNCDIAEELTRLEGHLTAYKDALSDAKDVGKKLDFIAQEMQREANTIGAKSSDIRISECVIDIKSEIEKIREQIRNIE